MKIHLILNNTGKSLIFCELYAIFAFFAVKLYDRKVRKGFSKVFKGKNQTFYRR